MVKLALNFICKNEAHVITTMLGSARPITDLIVAVDTGSSDNTISLVNEFGRKHAIPVFVFERPFDNFGNSRNYALDRLHEVVRQLDWDPEVTWGFFLDCDEIMHLSPQFKKTDLNKDILLATVTSDGTSFPRGLFFHLSRNLSWEGPIHEILSWNDPSVTQGWIKTVSVQAESKGASWKGDPEAKFLHYAKLLSQYIEDGHNSYRWVFYTGASYMTAAENCKDKGRKKELLSLAKKYYERASQLEIPTLNEKINLHRSLGETRILLGDPCPEIRQLFLTAYSWDTRSAESIASLIRYYMSENKWQTAYLFSSFAKKTYHFNNPGGQGVVETEDALYRWELLLYHYKCCYNSGRRKEAAATRAELKACMQSHPEYFSYKDLVYIQSNSAFYLSLRNLRRWVKNRFAA